MIVKFFLAKWGKPKRLPQMTVQMGRPALTMWPLSEAVQCSLESATVETGSIIVPLLEPQGPKDRHLRVSSIAYAHKVCI